MPGDLLSGALTEIARDLREKRVTARELIEAAIARHERFGERLHAHSLGQSVAPPLSAPHSSAAEGRCGNRPCRGRNNMEIGAAIFFTDYSMSPTDLAAALEERGFDSLWVAEHSHISLARAAA